MIKAYLLMGFEDLTPAYQIRKAVFVEEQGFDEALDQDQFDAAALHVVVEDGAPCATGRLYFDGDTWHIGRICVLKEKRGMRLGDLVMRVLLFQAMEMKIARIFVGAQLHAVNFYKKYGFEVCGEEYLDENCPHLPMRALSEKIQAMVFSGCGGDCANCSSDCATKEQDA